VFQTTTNDGASWSRHIVPVRSDAAGYPAPMVAADPSRRGHFAVAVMNGGASGSLLSGGYPTGTELLVYQTSDSGNSWSGPTIVTDDTAKTHRKAWMAYSRAGTLALDWLTDEPGPAKTWILPPPGPPFGPSTGPGTPVQTYPYNIYAAISFDGGTTFSQPLKASQVASPPWDPYNDITDCCTAISISDASSTIQIGWTSWLPKGSLGNPGDDAASFFSSVKFGAFTFH
jgi:hypothetical protein